MSARTSAKEIAALADTFCEPLTAPQWSRAVEEVSSTAPDLAAQLAFELYGRGLLAASVLDRAVPEAWSLCESPLWALGHVRWRELFNATGFTIDGVPAPPPRGPVVLYRGSSHLRRRGWSWTPDLSIAARFALRHGLEGGDAHIYSAEVPPSALLAVVSPNFVFGGGLSSGEREVVVDTAGLTIKLLERNICRRWMSSGAGL